MTEGGKNYKLDELIGYYLINLYYINNSTNPNLSISPLPTDKIEKPNLQCNNQTKQNSNGNGIG